MGGNLDMRSLCNTRYGGMEGKEFTEYEAIGVLPNHFTLNPNPNRSTGCAIDKFELCQAPGINALIGLSD